MSYKELVGHRLKELRASKTYTAKEVAKKIGARIPQIFDWESGKFTPTNRYKVRLAEVYGTTVYDIFFDGIPEYEEQKAVEIWLSC